MRPPEASILVYEIQVRGEVMGRQRGLTAPPPFSPSPHTPYGPGRAGAPLFKGDVLARLQKCFRSRRERRKSDEATGRQHLDENHNT